MKSRRLAPFAVIAAVLIGTTGCNLTAPQATTIQYAPAEGVNAASGDVLVRNAVIVSDDGVDGNFLAAFVNEGSEPQVVTIEYGEGAAKTTETFRIAARSAVSLGADVPASATDGESVLADAEPILFTDIDTLPGATMPVYFQAGDAEGNLVQVPVLSSELEYLAPFAP
ncbi:DNA modification methylase [Microbacterium limosum]|uniref:DNA modification methylase n=1 Tax=Microbacterium limosum TaxID=3079935 RepID=A0AAU0MFZ2_9MICO|nr:DNA modification methylase [Microbacterium sp. Y20]WOQ69085.1 DNA modification methylase [Microbacterium sp. Y20]